MEPESGHAQVPVRISPEDVFDDNNGLLYNIVDLGLDQLQQNIDASLSSPLQTDGASANGPDTAPHKVHIHLCCILLELQQHLCSTI